jgi:hypothetical protein
VSSHYVVRSSDGQITQMVAEKDTAWHARSANPYSIGIEHEGYVDQPSWFTDAMYRSSAALTRTSPTAVFVECQIQGDTVTAGGYTNNWWSKLRDQGGYMTNIYIDDPNQKLPGVPDC